VCIGEAFAGEKLPEICPRLRLMGAVREVLGQALEDAMLESVEVDDAGEDHRHLALKCATDFSETVRNAR